MNLRLKQLDLRNSSLGEEKVLILLRARGEILKERTRMQETMQ
jgi:hypothetical protein